LYRLVVNDAASIDIGHRFYCQPLTLLFMIDPLRIMPA